MQNPSENQQPLNLLISELEHAFRRVNDRASRYQHQLEALLRISEATTSNLPLHQIFDSVLEEVLKATDCISGGIRILNEKQKCFSIVAERGWTQQMYEDISHVPMDKSFQGDVVRTRAPVISYDLENDPRIITPDELKQGNKSLVSIPLLAGDRLVGTMELVKKTDYIWTDEDLRWLSNIGRQVGTAIHLVKVTEQHRAIAVIQERKRLGQELHDGIVQTLGLLCLQIDDALTKCEEGNQVDAHTILKSLYAATQETYTNLRDEILGLRLNMLDESDFITLLREYLRQFEHQWGIETHLIRESNEQWQNSIVEVQLMRIIQEAMTNIRRHSNARRATITIIEEGDSYELTIEDDGEGFDPDDVITGQMGIQIMCERASSLGGTCELVSQPGKGTRIRVVFPRFSSPLIFREASS